MFGFYRVFVYVTKIAGNALASFCHRHSLAFDITVCVFPVFVVCGGKCVRACR